MKWQVRVKAPEGIDNKYKWRVYVVHTKIVGKGLTKEEAMEDAKTQVRELIDAAHIEEIEI